MAIKSTERVRVLDALALMLTVAWGGALSRGAPVFFDTFDGEKLDSRWTVDTAPAATMSVDRDRQVLVLTGPEHDYNHVETQLPPDTSRVQMDACSINDMSASWAPSLILYWDKDNYARVMVSLPYSLRFSGKAAGEPVGKVTKVPLQVGRWYTAAMEMTEDSVAVLFGKAGETLQHVGTVPRPAGWRGTPTLIVGKGYMTGEGETDFDNSYHQPGRMKRVEIDNVVAGDTTQVADAMRDSSTLRVQGVAHDPAALEVAFWPNVTRKDTRHTLSFAPDTYQRLCLVYANSSQLRPAEEFAVRLRVPAGIAVREITFGDIPVTVTSTPSGGHAELLVRPEAYLVPAAHQGVDREDESRAGWFRWPISSRTPAFYIHCTADSTAHGASLMARAEAHSGAGPWREMRVKVLPPLSDLLPRPERNLGLSAWQGVLVHPSPDSDLVADRMMRNLKRLGIRRIHTNKHSRGSVVAAAKAHGVEPFMSSWWHYSWQNAADFEPGEGEEATHGRGKGRNFCPVVIGSGIGTYGRFLETVTVEMRKHGCTGFMLDYECAMPLCYCEKCRKAFLEYSGLDDVAWPNAVRKDQPHDEKWIAFRCHQGAQYVRSIRDAARRAVPGCPMQAWVAGYDYNNTIENATIDVSKADDFLTEIETPHYTLPADYSDMWTNDAGIGSIEAGIQTVEDTLAVADKPVIFCSSIIYPLGAATPWSDPQLLDVQIKTVIAAGVRGISFWGGHDSGAIDGRYMHKLVTWSNLLTAAGDFLWQGTRDDDALHVSDGDSIRLRRFCWRHKDRYMVALTNLSQDDRQTTVRVENAATGATQLITGAKIDLRRPLNVPALDGVFLIVPAP